MPAIEIRRPDGKRDILELSKSLPISVGQHMTNDVTVEGKGVAAIHCRISWNKQRYEVTAAGTTGVEVNGKETKAAELRDSDTIKVGPVTIVYRENTPVSKKGDGDLKSSNSRSGKNKKVDLQNDEPSPRGLADIIDEDDDQFANTPTKKAPPPEPPRPAWMGPTLRPGERQIVKSPPILVMGGAVLVLLLVAATLYFVIGRTTAQQEYDVAQAEFDQRKYDQAILLFNQFLTSYPSHEKAPQASWNISEANVRRHTDSASPNWESGLKELQILIRDQQGSPIFSEENNKKTVVSLAREIALGAAVSAGTTKRRELLKISDGAREAFQNYSEKTSKLDEDLRLIQNEARKSEQALRKNDSLSTAKAAMSSAVEKKLPLDALRARRELVETYPDLEADKDIKSRLQESLNIAKSLVKSEKPKRKAERDDPQVGGKLPLICFRQTRARSDIAPGSELVFGVIEDQLYAFESLTGLPRWRRSIGINLPFSPIEITGDVQSLLLFDTNSQELELIKTTGGELIWRQPIGEQLTGEPLIKDGLIYCSTLSGKLHEVDQTTGELYATLSFPQTISSTPTESNTGPEIVVAGNEGFLYSIVRPLDCSMVTFTNHLPGSITAPMLRMGNILLILENDRQGSCRLRAFGGTAADQPLVQRGEARITGTTRDKSVLRGNILYIPTTDERVYAFSVSDEPNAKTLTQIALYQEENPTGSVVFLTPGPDDEIWMSGKNLQRLKLAGDTLTRQGNRISLGACISPPTSRLEDLFLAGRAQGGTGTQFMSVHRGEMAGQWQVTLGARWLGITTQSIGVTSNGDLWAITPDQLAKGGFEGKSIGSLGGNNPVERVRASVLPSGQIALACGGTEPRLWIISAQGKIESVSPLPAPPLAAPIVIGKECVVPLVGKLKVLDIAKSGLKTDDFELPFEGSDAPPEWLTLLPINETQFLALLKNGKLSRMQVRMEPTRHLFEVSSLDCAAPIDFLPAVDGTQMAIVTEKNLRIVEGTTLEQIATRDLESPPSQSPALVPGMAFVTLGRENLCAYRRDQQLPEIWKVPLGGSLLAGGPLLEQNQLLVALQDGRLWVLNPEDGKIIKESHSGQRLANGPTRIGEMIVVMGLDGSLIPWPE